MNFQDLKRIEDAQFYLELAFRTSKRTGEAFFPRTSGDQLSRAIKTEHEKIRSFNKTITERLGQIIKDFPSLDSLPEFYQELVRYTLDYDFLKKSLGAIAWAKQASDDMAEQYMRQIRRAKSLAELKKTMGGYYGRQSSIMRQVAKNLAYLEDTRKAMLDYPTLKTDLYTVAITGFPNIGKSTLLSKLTPAKPKIENYAFTTKGLNQGYANYGIRKVQFVDTPGVLGRDKRNAIEEQAYLVLKYLANLIIYVVDLTESYPLKEQEKLLEGLKEYDKAIIVYLSKTDILPKDKVAKAKRKYKAATSVDELNKKLEKAMKEYYFDL